MLMKGCEKHPFFYAPWTWFIPYVRSIFYIHGKKYMAEKITATFSAETGMSQLLKMVCYRVL